MTNFLIKRFIKNPEDIKNSRVREAYGVFASIIGIICNILLFIIKFVVGNILNSVSIMADSFNNLSDCASSALTILGFKLSNKPADNEHPFGHGRTEYLAALGISLLIMIMGYEFLRSSILKIINKDVTGFDLISVVILILTVVIKIWLSRFNFKVGRKIDSKALIATAQDAKNDVIITSVTIISIMFTKITNINIDGFAGIIVAIILLKNGFDIAKDSLSPLLGEAVPPELAKEIKTKIESYDGIVGSHDLIIHNYGPGKSMATIHAEVPRNQDIMYSHEIIDKIEREFSEETGITLLIHMDPIETNDPRINYLSSLVQIEINEFDSLLSAHDFRLVDGKNRINFIFDLAFPHNYSKEKEDKITKVLIEKIKNIDEKYKCIINKETGFILIDESE